jgi:hypothetical protein
MQASLNRPVRRLAPVVLTERIEEILRAVHLYRYMTARDVTRLLYSPSSLKYVGRTLSALAGNEDFRTNQYLYRFCLPSTAVGTKERIYTLGVKGRDLLRSGLGLPVDWYFRPYKVRHLSYSHVLHNLVLTRFLVAAAAFAKNVENFRLCQTRTGYELSKVPPSVTLNQEGKKELIKVIPDAWLLFERIRTGVHDAYFPVLLEIDRGREYQQKFKQHVRSRIEFVKKGGAYSSNSRKQLNILISHSFLSELFVKKMSIKTVP